MTLTSALCLHHISPKLFEEALLNFSCGCILMLEIAAYYFGVTMASTLTEHIFYMILHRTPKFGMWIHLGPCCVNYCFGFTVTLTSGFSLDRSSPEHICISFPVGVQNFVCRYILVLWIVIYCFWIILTLTNSPCLRKLR